MRLRIVLTILLVILLTAAALSVQAGIGSIRGATASQTSGSLVNHAGAYAIYSAMIEASAYAAENPTIAIAPVTRPAMSQAQPCVGPPRRYSDRWTEVLADFNARKDKPETLVRDLNISKPYVFVTDAEASAFIGYRNALTRPNGQTTTSEAPRPPERLRGVTHVFYLTDVYFSKDGG